MCAITITMKRTSDAVVCSERPRKMQRILMSSLPDRMRAAASTETMSPESLLASTTTTTVQSYAAMVDFFQPPTQEEIDAYDHHALAAIRNQDMATLRQYHQQGRPLKCSNKFGESLLHMACRKGMLQVVLFMTQTAHVPLQVCDDYGRSPLHDACWAHTTNFELVDLILTECPDLLYIQDKRGNTPLSYLKQEKWAAWNQYLNTKTADFFKPRFAKQLLL
jgi:Ankyrin repeats (3 copies)